MKRWVVFTIVAAQLMTAAQPAVAADFAGDSPRTGMFAGFRLRAPLAGDNRGQAVRAGLTVAPTLRARSTSGEVRTRFGEGLELGLRGGEPVRLSIAGTPVSRLVQGRNAPEGDRAGVSTLGWVAIGVGALVTVVLVAGAICLSDNDCIPSE